MRDLKAGYMKHTHPVGYEDQRNQDYKEVVQDKVEVNNFVFREVPKHRTYRVADCPNASSDLAAFRKGKSFSAGKNVRDYEVPELVVFLLEDNQQFVKDICIDREESTDPNRSSCLFDPEMENSSESNAETTETMSSNSNESESASQHPCTMDGMKNYGVQNLAMEGEVELDSGDKNSTDLATKKTRSQTLQEAFERESDLSRLVNNWEIDSFITTNWRRMEFPHLTECQDFFEITNMCRPEKGNPQSLTDSGTTFDCHHGEGSSCATGPASGRATKSRRDSRQSNDSTSSTHSFAFPILPTEWNGSPVRMAEADGKKSIKHQWRKIFSPCCW